MEVRRVLVLEDYEDYRLLISEALTEAFGDVVIEEAATIAAADALIAATTFDLAVLDLHLPDGSGIDVIRTLRQSCPTTFCVVATVFDDDDKLFESLKAGAHGYLLKAEPRPQLIAYLEGILNGRPPLSSSMAAKMIAHFNAPPATDQVIDSMLTDREKDVLRLIALGRPRKQIARDLDISLHTANDHVKAIYRKLNVSSSTEAARIAIKSGLSQ